MERTVKGVACSALPQTERLLDERDDDIRADGVGFFSEETDTGFLGGEFEADVDIARDDDDFDVGLAVAQELDKIEAAHGRLEF